MPTPPEDLPSLEALERKIEQAKELHSPSREPHAPPSGMGLAMRLSVELGAAIFVGGFLGYYLDTWLETSPWLFILCFFLGASAGTLTIMRSVQRENLEK